MILTLSKTMKVASKDEFWWKYLCFRYSHFFKKNLTDFVSGEEEDIPPVKVTPAEEDRVKQLELELAKTKLALVEKECYTQELLHQLATSIPAAQAECPQSVRSSNSWLSKTFNSIRSQPQTALSSSSLTTNLESEPRERSNSVQQVSRTNSGQSSGWAGQ